VPYSQVMPRCACVVTHGGMGTTHQALAAGVPVCAVPFARDQLENARRVEVARAGTQLSPRRLTARRLRHAVEEAIRRRPGAIRIADAFSHLDAPRTAADALEALTASRSLPHP
jgi:UDP:flavonoid glycosyltransferase YjiC (YdhE family)